MFDDKKEKVVLKDNCVDKWDGFRYYLMNKDKKSSQYNFNQFKVKLMNQNIGDSNSLDKSDYIELTDNISISPDNSVTIIGFREGETVSRPVDGLGFVEVKQSNFKNKDVSLRDREGIVVESCVNEKSSLLSKRNDCVNEKEYIGWKGKKKVEFSLDWDDNNNNNNNKVDDLSSSMKESILNDKGFMGYFNLTKRKNVFIKDNDNKRPTIRKVNITGNNEGSNEFSQYSIMDNNDINWSFSQFIEFYHIQEIFSLLPVLFICIMYLYYKIKVLFDYCMFYYRDFRFFSFSILPASVKSNSNINDSAIIESVAPFSSPGGTVPQGISNNLTDTETKSIEWVNPVPKPIKIGDKYDWSKVELWELERIQQSRWETSSEFKKKTLQFIDVLNEKINNDDNRGWRAKPMDYLWKVSKEIGINPNDISIRGSNSGKVKFNHKDFEWLDGTKNSVIIKDPRSYAHITEKMDYGKIAPGYECQMTFYIKEKGMIVADRGSFYEKSELGSNVSNYLNKRGRSNTLSSEDSNNSSFSNKRKVRSDSLKENENGGSSSQHSVMDEFNIDCINIDMPLYGMIEINIYYTIISFIFIICIFITYLIVLFIKRLIYIIYSKYIDTYYSIWVYKKINFIGKIKKYKEKKLRK